MKEKEATFDIPNLHRLFWQIIDNISQAELPCSEELEKQNTTSQDISMPSKSQTKTFPFGLFSCLMEQNSSNKNVRIKLLLQNTIYTSFLGKYKQPLQTQLLKKM